MNSTALIYTDGKEDLCDTSFYYRDVTQLDWVRYIFIVLYSVVIILSVLGNVFVIFTVYTNKHMRTVTNYYIVNLAASDLLVAIFVMPLKLLEYIAPCSWHVFGHDALCSFMSFMLPVFVFASVLTLAAISLERFYAIVHPLKAKIISGKGRTRKIITMTWVVAVIFATPYLYGQTYAFNIQSDYGTVHRQICNDRFDDIDRAMFGDNAGVGRFRKGFFIFLFVVMYLCPSAVILYTCVHMTLTLLKTVDTDKRLDSIRKLEESKRKVARMIVIVAALFLLCWAPFYLVNVISVLQKDNFLQRSNFLFTMLLTHFTGFINSCVNPIVYCILSEKFSNSFKDIVFAAVCRLLGCFSIRSHRCCWSFVKTHAHRCHRCAAHIMRNSSKRISRHSWRTSALYKNAASDNGGEARLSMVTNDVHADTRELVLKSHLHRDEQTALTCEEVSVTCNVHIVDDNTCAYEIGTPHNMIKLLQAHKSETTSLVDGSS